MLLQILCIDLSLPFLILFIAESFLRHKTLDMRWAYLYHGGNLYVRQILLFLRHILLYFIFFEKGRCCDKSQNLMKLVENMNWASSEKVYPKAERVEEYPS